MLFKGGTSLSKAFGIIEWFSEDVDLSFNRVELGFGGESDPPTLERMLELLRQIEEEINGLFGG